MHNSGSRSMSHDSAMTDQPTTRKAREHDRRSGADRRQVDSLPPGKIDRRRSVDARKPDVLELDMSNSEWTALNQAPSPPTKPTLS